jgi:hypothetical protein
MFRRWSFRLLWGRCAFGEEDRQTDAVVVYVFDGQRLERCRGGVVCTMRSSGGLVATRSLQSSERINGQRRCNRRYRTGGCHRYRRQVR